ncbi:hypothetical protein WCLP8_3920003 [uncultured Gammaproteobacteria bacterium]
MGGGLWVGICGLVWGLANALLQLEIEGYAVVLAEY